ncbi:hypothetical protein QFZ22_001399 [Streptomyces canus]|uniref:Uncharacterized protein n=1 Tax=Streptomyces canus TaxID=58343 RepID=A0AAW8F6G6_9ACTN|nr:hypothetical protein [Streptomyces canus]
MPVVGVWRECYKVLLWSLPLVFDRPYVVRQSLSASTALREQTGRWGDERYVECRSGVAFI